MIALTEGTASRDYARIEAAIRFLDQHVRRQPSLEEVAAATGLSTFHFQRVFKRWAGVSPKRFLQYLTAQHARHALRNGHSVLATALDVGLSGPGRLHDLFVSVDAVTPGEYKEGGPELSIRYGVHPSPFGDCFLAVTNRGIIALEFPEGPRDVSHDRLARCWPAAAIHAEPEETGDMVRRIFSGGSGRPITLFLKGTNFQLKVWRALLSIPDGRLVTYGDVARTVGRMGAERAVGTAVARNPVAFLIPCHRVIRQTGQVGGYRWGTARKRAMIGWEAIHS